jgi:hypothetical protein
MRIILKMNLSEVDSSDVKSIEKGSSALQSDPCSRWFLACGFFYPEDAGDTFLRNVGSHKIYTASHPRRRHSS